MSALGRIKVLVADHNRWTRLCVTRMLSEAGFDVDEASNGMSAVRRVLAEPPQVLVVGHALPEISPAEVLLTLRDDPRVRHTALVQIEPTCSSAQLVAEIVYALEGLHDHTPTGAATPAPAPEPLAALV